MTPVCAPRSRPFDARSAKWYLQSHVSRFPHLEVVMRPSIRPVLLLPILACLLLVGGYAAHRGPPPGHARTYYVAADEVAWDYPPSGSDQLKDRPFDDTNSPFVEAGPHWVGHVAMKALYREYTDSTFKTLKPLPAPWQHLGLLGPVLRAEVGDT